MNSSPVFRFLIGELVEDGDLVCQPGIQWVKINEILNEKGDSYPNLPYLRSLTVKHRHPSVFSGRLRDNQLFRGLPSAIARSRNRCHHRRNDFYWMLWQCVQPFTSPAQVISMNLTSQRMRSSMAQPVANGSSTQ